MTSVVDEPAGSDGAVLAVELELAPPAVEDPVSTRFFPLPLAVFGEGGWTTGGGGGLTTAKELVH